MERSCSLFQKQVALTQLFKMLCLGQYQKKCRKLACCKFWFTLFRSLRREFIAFTDNIIQRPVKVVGFHETYPMEAGMMPASQPVQWALFMVESGSQSSTGAVCVMLCTGLGSYVVLEQRLAFLLLQKVFIIYVTTWRRWNRTNHIEFCLLPIYNSIVRSIWEEAWTLESDLNVKCWLVTHSLWLWKNKSASGSSDISSIKGGHKVHLIGGR